MGWPLVVFGIALLAAVVAIIVTGNDVSGLNDTLTLVMSGVGAAGGIGAWVKSSQAANQTNGVMDQRIADGVEQGITRALDQARAAAEQPPAAGQRPRPSARAS
jgi:hypothetical protein